jgi:translation initiation factor IF-3
MNNEPRINDRIRAREVRLVGPDGAQIGITPLPKALDMARELELDLVEVADKANPPVCRIMDYGKYKYEAAQRAKESRKKSTNVVVKEMKYRPKIGAGDFGTKTKKVAEFLGEGHKVKITIMFRGREMQHPELGRKILDQVAETVTEVGKVEIYPRLDGRNMTMVLGPDKKAQAAAEKKRSAPEDSTASPSVSDVLVPDTSESAATAAEAPEVTSPETEVPETAATETDVIESEAAGTEAAEEVIAESVIAEEPEDSDTSEA